MSLHDLHAGGSAECSRGDQIQGLIRPRGGGRVQRSGVWADWRSRQNLLHQPVEVQAVHDEGHNTPTPPDADA